MEDDQGGGGGTICNGSDSSSMKIAHQAHSSNTNLFHTGNSFELAAGASLSDDSGFVPHTNSSISSCGSSSRGIGLCRFELELAESDAEVSQFDSLDNFSDGGMSAENYNTLKKGPLAPIDPPPEFQDSPQTTLMRSQCLQSFSNHLTKAIISNAISDYSQMSSGSISSQSSNRVIYFDTSSDSNHTTILKGGSCRKHGIVQKKCRQHLYGSDSFLDKYEENIYDEPNGDYYDNHLLYSNIDETTAMSQLQYKQQQPQLSVNHNQIYDYDLYYYRKRNLTPVNSYKRRRTPTSSVLYSPLHQHHHHHHYYHTGSSNSTGNRPNSRNSLNSRLSSSHNSLSVPNANKADDSIFITQAMSHDALVGRGEISDLYNVPIDSDIYALPVDSVSNKTPNSNVRQHKKKSFNSKGDSKPPKSRPKYTRNKRRRRQNLHTSKSNATNLTASSLAFTTNNTSDKRHSVPENRFEPLHMTLDEVKRYYHTLYSSSSESGQENHAVNNNNNITTTSKKEITSTCVAHQNNNHNLASGKTNGTVSYNNKQIVTTATITSTTTTVTPPATMKTPTTIVLKSKKIVPKDQAKINFNNNTIQGTTDMVPSGKTTENGTTKYSNKKSQFSITFNLRQKFCNIFRFKNKHNKDSDTIYGGPGSGQNGQKHMVNGSSNKLSNEDKRIQLSSRALPPLPNSGMNYLNIFVNQ